MRYEDASQGTRQRRFGLATTLKHLAGQPDFGSGHRQHPQRARRTDKAVPHGDRTWLRRAYHRPFAGGWDGSDTSFDASGNLEIAGQLRLR
jgi:hypothetical protein